MTPFEAIEIVARDVIQDAVEFGSIDDKWEDYPDLGKWDWERVVHEARRMAKSSYSDSQFDEAYALLSARVNEDAE